MDKITAGGNYGMLRPSFVIARGKKRQPHWRCGCLVCKARVTLTPKKVLKGKCPECKGGGN